MKSFIVSLSVFGMLSLFATESFAQLRCVHIGGYIICYGARSAQMTTETQIPEIQATEEEANDLVYTVEDLIKQAEKEQKKSK